jgi:hypothetical protein
MNVSEVGQTVRIRGCVDGLPILPNTGPGFARSEVSHTAKPSPKRECPFPLTCIHHGVQVSRFVLVPPLDPSYAKFHLNLEVWRLEG